MVQDAISGAMDPFEPRRSRLRQWVHGKATRVSLVERLRDLGDESAWKAFFDIYWRLLYGFARSAGLSESDAEDVVQETVVAVARKMPEFQYDRDRCTFKGWLFFVARRRILDHFRRIGRRPEGMAVTESWEDETVSDNAPAAAAGSGLELAWEGEWAAHVLDRALDRVKQVVRPEHFEIYYLNVIQDQKPAQVAAALGVGRGRIYLVKHRISKMVEEEIRRIENEEGS